MDAVHLASSRQVHLSSNGVIVDTGTHATRQFLCPPMEIRFATLRRQSEPRAWSPPHPLELFRAWLNYRSFPPLFNEGCRCAVHCAYSKAIWLA